MSSQPLPRSAEQGSPEKSAGGYDPDRVAAAARQQDPGLPPETASLLAGRAWDHLRRLGELDAPALARLMMSEEHVGATPANVVATAAVEFCTTYGVQP